MGGQNKSTTSPACLPACLPPVAHNSCCWAAMRRPRALVLALLVLLWLVLVAHMTLSASAEPAAQGSALAPGTDSLSPPLELVASEQVSDSQDDDPAVWVRSAARTCAAPETSAGFLPRGGRPRFPLSDERAQSNRGSLRYEMAHFRDPP
jgi:hypothetical protein